MVVWMRREDVLAGAEWAFLRETARKLVAAHRRKASRRTRLEDTFAQDIRQGLHKSQSGQSPDAVAADGEKQTELQRMILRLPRGMAEASHKVLIEGRTLEDAAAFLGISREAVRKAISRSIRRLKKHR